ncbi:murein hydrolase activator EnvC family protein [Virgibacillus sp. W0430]|uniref:murein hydrolase activator EnvC family protein n=1 Tax=Virgibacillus sp. W0430 TaxID=3391580 RepID=UPI003F46E9F2
MKKTVVAIATVAVVGLSNVFFTDSIDAASNLQEIKDERSDIKKNLSDAEAKIADVLIDLKEINEEIKQVEASLKANQEATKEVQAEMDELNDEIAELEAAIEERFNILKERAKSYQRNGGNIAYLDVILGSSSFGEFISRVNAVTKITDSDAELIEQQEEDKAKVEEKLSELNELKEELLEMEQLILEQKEANEQKKKELQAKENELKELKSKLQVKDKKLAALEADIYASMQPASSTTASAQSASNGKSGGAAVTGGGVLGWPTKGGYISSHMGPRGGRMHKGMDIARTDRSTSPPIYAADGGTVVSAGYSGAYGNKVVINHNNGMQTVYAHLASLNVSAGQNVSRGTKLGIMGRTGRSTGIHLHFEVYVNGKLQNPAKYF